MKKINTRKIAVSGVLGALALVLSALENVLMPSASFLPPGAKPGLSNLVIMFSASELGVSYTFLLVIIKAVFALITRGMTAFLMSLVGGILSTTVLLILLKINFKSLTFVGIGVICSCAHNAGQLLVSLLMTGTFAVLGYAPYLLIFSVVTGFITGTIVKIVLPKTKNILKFIE